MEEKEPTLRDELWDLLRTQLTGLYHWFRPLPGEALWLQILKIILKLPALAFVLLLSPVLLLIVVVIFVILI